VVGEVVFGLQRVGGRGENWRFSGARGNSFQLELE
jgi:hypothetical protein